MLVGRSIRMPKSDYSECPKQNPPEETKTSDNDTMRTSQSDPIRGFGPPAGSVEDIA